MFYSRILHILYAVFDLQNKTCTTEAPPPSIYFLSLLKSLSGMISETKSAKYSGHKVFKSKEHPQSTTSWYLSIHFGCLTESFTTIVTM